MACLPRRKCSSIQTPRKLQSSPCLPPRLAKATVKPFINLPEALFSAHLLPLVVLSLLQGKLGHLLGDDVLLPQHLFLLRHLHHAAYPILLRVVLQVQLSLHLLAGLLLLYHLLVLLVEPHALLAAEPLEALRPDAVVPQRTPGHAHVLCEHRVVEGLLHLAGAGCLVRQLGLRILQGVVPRHRSVLSIDLHQLSLALGLLVCLLLLAGVVHHAHVLPVPLVLLLAGLVPHLLLRHLLLVPLLDLLLLHLGPVLVYPVLPVEHLQGGHAALLRLNGPAGPIGEGLLLHLPVPGLLLPLRLHVLRLHLLVHVLLRLPLLQQKQHAALLRHSLHFLFPKSFCPLHFFLHLILEPTNINPYSSRSSI
mmetsp:Transcript_12106/g.17850  ORF Transcript_12106/g.17850 Transcript_12106/m.17850 type:complete len:364 (+) Transcript_12106:184-1275(+)